MKRRDFLKTAAAAAPYVLTSGALGAGAQPAANERIVVGCIGVGGRGRLNLNGLLTQGGHIAAVCDVNARARKAAVAEIVKFYDCKGVTEKFTGCAVLERHEDVLERPDIDAVMIATPDHWHVPIAMAAVRAGKDVYVEKPLGISIAEGQALRDAVRRYGAVFMHGTEQRCMRQFRHACELVRNGRLGKLHTIKVGCPGGRVTGAHPAQPVPKGLDWDRWLGPARAVPYTPARCKAGSWYFISDYAASGFIAGWGIHHVDIAQWALDADDSGPVAIEGTGVLPPDGLYDTPVTWHIDYTYANGVKLDFRDNKQNAQGIRFEGTDGWVHANRQTIQAEPKNLLTSVIRASEVRLPRWDNDDRNFLDCVKNRAETASPVEAAHRSTAVCYLGDIAVRLKRKLQWDPQAERFPNDPEADRLLTRPMRTPWRL